MIQYRRILPRCISSLRHAQRLVLFKQTVGGLCLPVFRYPVAVDFIQQPATTNPVRHLLKYHSSR